MEFITLYYFRELSKTLNMTKTAKKLYISQQTLSNHILRLEKECGSELFYRKPSLTLTNAGEIMLEFSKKILTEEANLNDILLDVNNQKTGTINFGASSLRMNACLPNILPSFNEVYPDVKINLFDGISKQLEPLIESGELDLAIVVSNKDYVNLNKKHLMDDQLFICVPNKLLVQYYGESILDKRSEFIKGVTIDEFKKLPFLGFDNRLGRQIYNCFVEANFEPNIYARGSYVQIMTGIGLTGVAAFFNSRLSLTARKHEIPEDMNIFPLLFKGAPMYQTISLISNKDRYATKYMTTFSNMLCEFFAAAENEKVERIGLK